MNILIVDSKSTENYDFKYMESHPLGGTESTVLRLAKELAKEHNVYISQVNRTEKYTEAGVTYIQNSKLPFQNDFIPDTIIILRKYKLLKTYNKLYPNAKLLVWIHNFQKYEILGRRYWIAKTNAKIVCVSHHHQNYINNILNGYISWIFRLCTLQFKNIPVTYVYNTIEQDFSKKNITVDPNKLFFFSAPYKGLNEVLDHFSRLLEKAPDYKLYVTAGEASKKSYNLNKELINSDSVIFLDRLPKNKIIEHLQESFCVFYPQHKHPETFGLVYVESNCAEVPVLAHDFGSAAEVMVNKQQLVDSTNPTAVINKMLDWKINGRPKVTCDERFSISHAIIKWKKVLNLA